MVITTNRLVARMPLNPGATSRRTLNDSGTSAPAIVTSSPNESRRVTSPPPITRRPIRRRQRVSTGGGPVATGSAAVVSSSAARPRRSPRTRTTTPAIPKPVTTNPGKSRFSPDRSNENSSNGHSSVSTMFSSIGDRRSPRCAATDGSKPRRK